MDVPQIMPTDVDTLTANETPDTQIHTGKQDDTS